MDETKAGGNSAKASVLLKSLANGQVVFNKVYQNGNFVTNFRGKVVISTNHPLSTDSIDEALTRRTIYFKFSKYFTSISTNSNSNSLYDNSKMDIDINGINLNNNNNNLNNNNYFTFKGKILSDVEKLYCFLLLVFVRVIKMNDKRTKYVTINS